MTNERLDGSGKVCRHCKVEIEKCGSPVCTHKGWIHKESTSHFCDDTYSSVAEPPSAQPSPDAAKVEEIARQAAYKLHRQLRPQDQIFYDPEKFAAILRPYFPQVSTPRFTSGYVQTIDPSLDGNPSCHVCGAVMVRLQPSGHRPYWICQSCGTSTLSSAGLAGEATEGPKLQCLKVVNDHGFIPDLCVLDFKHDGPCSITRPAAPEGAAPPDDPELAQDIEDALDTLETIDGVVKLRAEVRELRAKLDKSNRCLFQMQEAAKELAGKVKTFELAWKSCDKVAADQSNLRGLAEQPGALPRRERICAMKPKRRMKYRTGVNTKTLKQFNVRVSDEVHDFFEIHSYDENGRKLSKAKVLERVIAIARRLMFSPLAR